jgi:glycosyltransferase involved in cell wall biosynthesis
MPPAATSSPLDAAWRARALAAQDGALPHGRVVLSCPAPFGGGGLGRHLGELDAALARGGSERMCICEAAPHATDHSPRSPARRGAITRLAPLARRSPAWRMWAASAGFDADAARSLPQAEHLIAFNGTAEAQFGAARQGGYRSLALVAANSHYEHVMRQHERAYRQYPLERPWGKRLLARNLREYALADRIYVASRYVWESFAEHGFSESVLARFPLTPDPRFAPVAAAPTSATATTGNGVPAATDSFDVVYVGSLTAHKGVPLLIDAFRRLQFADMRLVLVGGWGTRGMRRFVEQACAADSRIEVRPGDPLAHLHAASLYVHAAYEDGFAYAPAEALACGIPVIVSEDTGMKELIDHGRTGLVLPTGDGAALSEAIEAAYRGETGSG